MNLRTLAGRDGAMLLAVAWIAFGATAVYSTLAAGEPVQPWLFLGFLPAAVALAAAVRPGQVSDRRAAARLLVVLVAALLLFSLAALVGTAFGSGRPIIEPSPAVIYAMLAASTATAAHAVMGWREPRAAIGPLAFLLGGLSVATFGSLAVAGSAGVPPCAAPVIAPVSSARLFAEASVDGSPRASVTVGTRRDGSGERWAAALQRAPAEGRPAASAGTLAGDRTTDARLAAVLARLAGPGVEDLGVERLDALPARHCRALVEGPQALAAFPALHLLLEHGDASPIALARVLMAPPDPAAVLPVWRGELDWWLDADGRLRRAEARIGGHPGDAWGVRGLRGSIRATLTVDARDAAASGRADRSSVTLAASGSR